MERHWLVSLRSDRTADVHGRLPDGIDRDAARHWLHSGWPLSVTRQEVGCDDVFVGLPLPPGAQPRRVRFGVPRDAIDTCQPPLLLSQVAEAGPPMARAWLERVDREARGRGLVLRVFGSYAWACLTPWRHVTDASDVDVVCDLGKMEQIHGCAALFGSERHGRFDVELRFPSGRAVAMREWLDAAGQGRVLAKSLHGPSLVEAAELAAELQ